MLSDDHLARLSREHEPEPGDMKIHVPDTRYLVPSEHHSIIPFRVHKRSILHEHSESSATESARSAHSGQNSAESAPAASEPLSSSSQVTEYSYIIEFEMSELVGQRDAVAAEKP